MCDHLCDYRLELDAPFVSLDLSLDNNFPPDPFHKKEPLRYNGDIEEKSTEQWLC